MKKILTFLILLCFSIPAAMAQSKTITGKVVDAAGELLIGAGITEKGTSNRTVTDPKGEFKLTLTGNAPVLQITYVGYVTQEVTVGNKAIVHITLESDATKLGDYVVVGYGTQKKASVVGAISQVKAEELQRASTPNLSNAIAGRVSGVVTVMGSGKPGADDAQI
ncbi:carboxypeptidase-like regulatory domain-containing protein, partial [Chitinophaga sp.]|uniref:carboxypeptidase-like regulatory domain-containing protein n=1 Tax=Chitinophaga sp. TaxID=1869181 RepID=UPI002637964D